jgi:hypothetical protein
MSSQARCGGWCWPRRKLPETELPETELPETELPETELPETKPAERGSGEPERAAVAHAEPGGLPPWLGREVTRDDRYSGAALARLGLPAGWQTGG